jgi:hypothetical protein
VRRKTEAWKVSEIRSRFPGIDVSVYRPSWPPGSRGRDRSREGGEQMRGLGVDLRRPLVLD